MTIKKLEQIHELLNKGHTYREIGKKVKLPHTTVFYNAKKYPVEDEQVDVLRVLDNSNFQEVLQWRLRRLRYLNAENILAEIKSLLRHFGCH